MNLERENRLSKLATEDISSIEFARKYHEKHVIGLVTAEDLHTYEPTHVIVVGKAEEYDVWNAWKRATPFLPKEFGGLWIINLDVDQHSPYTLY